MICCGTLALAASLVLAVGRRVAMGLIVTGGVLVDPEGLVGHARMLICGA
jgi:hypothetical protein